MYCEKCGTQVDEGKFCPNCGSPLSQSAQPAYQPSYQPDPQPSYQQPAQQPPYAAQYGTPLRGPAGGVVLEAIRKLASSRLFLIAAIAYTAATVFAFVASLSLGNAARNLEFTMFFNVPEGVGEALRKSYKTSVSFDIGAILITIGLWICFFSASNREKPMPTSGLTIIKVITTIALVVFWIVLVVVLLLAVGGFMFSAELGQAVSEAIASEAPGVPIPASLSGGLLAVLMLVVAAVLVLFIVYYTKLIKMIKTMRDTVATGVPSDKISGFVAVMCYVSAFFTGISGFALLASGQIYSFIANACSAAAAVCFGMLIFRYRDTMRSLISA